VLTQLEFSQIILEEVPIINCHGNLCRWTDSGDTAASLISNFLQTHLKRYFNTINKCT